MFLYSRLYSYKIFWLLWYGGGLSSYLLQLILYSYHFLCINHIRWGRPLTYQSKEYISRYIRVCCSYEAWIRVCSQPQVGSSTLMFVVVAVNMDVLWLYISTWVGFGNIRSGVPHFFIWALGQYTLLLGQGVSPLADGIDLELERQPSICPALPSSILVAYAESVWAWGVGWSQACRHD